MKTDPIWPSLSGQKLKSGNLLVDVNGVSDGYVYVGVQNSTSARLKIRICKDGMVDTYDLRNSGFELFPIRFGDGEYTVSLYENAYSNKYAYKGFISFPVTLKDPYAYCLAPNQYANYSKDSKWVQVADSMCAGLSESDTYRKICDYVKNYFGYDYIRAGSVKKGVLPDLDRTFRLRMGLCQDLSALTVSMLRSQGIPSRLAIGYRDNTKHAWVESNINGAWIRFDPMFEILRMKSKGSYVAERLY